MNPDSIIKALRESDMYIENIFTEGGCYQFHLFLKTIYPSATPFINKTKDHIATMIGDKLYDIRGCISLTDSLKYRPLKDKERKMAEKWSFSKNKMIMLTECPACEEPLCFHPRSS